MSLEYFITSYNIVWHWMVHYCFCLIILLYFKALPTSYMPQQNILSEMANSMSHVACRLFDKYIFEESTENWFKVTYDFTLLQRPSRGKYIA